MMINGLLLYSTLAEVAITIIVVIVEVGSAAIFFRGCSTIFIAMDVARLVVKLGKK